MLRKQTLTVCLIVFVQTLLLLDRFGNTQLLINVRNQGGDVLQESISANASDDTVSLEFQRSDGTLVTQLIDFKNDVQILKALILGEEERGQSQYQVLCFVCHFQKDDFISSDAMAKLRQKNPGAVRTPEEDRGRENYTMDYTVDVMKAHDISPHIRDLCSEAADATYTRHQDVQLWAATREISESVLLAALKPFPSEADNLLAEEHTTVSIPNCGDTHSIWAACQCHLELCIGWYPCGLKYCKGKGESKNFAMTYRCGIKTCKKCNAFAYYVSQKQSCVWDE